MNPIPLWLSLLFSKYPLRRLDLARFVKVIDNPTQTGCTGRGCNAWVSKLLNFFCTSNLRTLCNLKINLVRFFFRFKVKILKEELSFHQQVYECQAEYVESLLSAVRQVWLIIISFLFTKWIHSQTDRLGEKPKQWSWKKNCLNELDEPKGAQSWCVIPEVHINWKKYTIKS